MTTTTKNQYEVFATIQLPISIKVEANNENEAKAIGQYQLHEMAIQQALLTLVNHNGQVISPNVHDFEIDVENIFED